MADTSMRDYIKNTIIGKHEKGYQAMPEDRGNTVDGQLIGTKFGISAKTLKKHLGRTPKVEEMKNLKLSTALDILESKYYTKPGINKLPEDIRKNVLDMSINAGPERAIKLLQQQSGAKQDGIIGPETIKKSGVINNNTYVNARKQYYESLAKRRPDNKKFLKGWLRRAESFKTEEPMAKEKKKEEKGPIGGMSLMDPLQQIMSVDLKEKPKMSKMPDKDKMSIMPEEQRISLSPPPPTSPPPSPVEKEEEMAKNVMTKGTRPDPEDVGEQKGLTQFQKALGYLGPRLIAQLVGGNDALATTDKIMKGFEEMGQQEAERSVKREAIDSREQIVKDRVKKAEQQAAARLAGESTQETAQLEQQLMDSEASIREFQELDAALAEGGLTGPLDTVIGSLERMGLKEGGKKPSYRLRLEKLKVNEGLANIAKTKGAISDREMKLFLSPAPKITDDESVWRDWIKSKMMMEQELNKRLSNRLNINNPEHAKQMISFDQVDQSIALQKEEEAEKAEMQQLRDKRRRMKSLNEGTKGF